MQKLPKLSLGHSMVAVAKLTIPIVAGMILPSLIGLTDSYFLSHFGNLPLASLNLLNACMILFFACLFGVGGYFAVQIGNSYGKFQAISQTIKQKYKNPNNPIYQKAIKNLQNQMALLLKNCLWVCMWYGLVSFLLLQLLFYALPYLHQPQELLDYMHHFWLLASLAFFIWTFNQAFKQFFDSINRAWTGALILSSMAWCNLPLSYSLIYGVGFLPELQLTGAGIAWVIAELIALSIFVTYYLFTPTLRNFRIMHGFFGPNGLCAFALKKLSFYHKIFTFDPTLRKNMRLSLPMAAEYTMETFAWASLGVMMGWFGLEAMAAKQITSSVGEVIYMLPLGATSAISILMAQIYDKKNIQEIKIMTHAAVITITLMTSITFLLVLVLRPEIVALMTKDPLVITLALGFFFFNACCQWIDGFQSALLGVLRGLGDFTIASMLGILGYIGMAMPLAYLVAFYLLAHPNGLYIGFAIGDAILVVMVFLRYRYIIKKLTKVWQ